MKATLALLSFNQEAFIIDAVKSVLSQTYNNLQIILSDDCSVDQTYELMQHVAKFSEYSYRDIVLNRNNSTLGIGGHINKIMDLSKGDIIIVAAGDDISHPNRVQKIVDTFLTCRAPTYSVWSSAVMINESGSVLSKPFPGVSCRYTDKTIVRNLNPVIGATHAWRREVFDVFGPLMNTVVFEDNAISFRSFLLGSIHYIPDKLVRYRLHSNSLTNFSSNNNKYQLYALAVRRCEWALYGIEQRRKDLSLYSQAYSTHAHNLSIVRSELSKQERKYSRRLHCYKQFPRISLLNLLYVFIDVEILKLSLVSCLYILIHFFRPAIEDIDSAST